MSVGHTFVSTPPIEPPMPPMCLITPTMSYVLSHAGLARMCAHAQPDSGGMQGGREGGRGAFQRQLETVVPQLCMVAGARQQQAATGRADKGSVLAGATACARRAALCLHLLGGPKVLIICNSSPCCPATPPSRLPALRLPLPWVRGAIHFYTTSYQPQHWQLPAAASHAASLHATGRDTTTDNCGMHG